MGESKEPVEAFELLARLTIQSITTNATTNAEVAAGLLRVERVLIDVKTDVDALLKKYDQAPGTQPPASDKPVERDSATVRREFFQAVIAPLIDPRTIWIIVAILGSIFGFRVTEKETLDPAAVEQLIYETYQTLERQGAAEKE